MPNPPPTPTGMNRLLGVKDDALHILYLVLPGVVLAVIGSEFRAGKEMHAIDFAAFVYSMFLILKEWVFCLGKKRPLTKEIALLLILALVAVWLLVAPSGLSNLRHSLGEAF